MKPQISSSWQANAYWESLADPSQNLLSIIPSWSYHDFVQNRKQDQSKASSRVYHTQEECFEWVYRSYIFFVINVNENHWISAILYAPSEIEGSNKRGNSCLLIFDSLGGRHPQVVQNIQYFIEDVVLPFWDDDFEVRDLPTYYPKASLCIPPVLRMVLTHVAIIVGSLPTE